MYAQLASTKAASLNYAIGRCDYYLGIDLSEIRI